MGLRVHWASFEGRLEIIKVLLLNKANENARDKNGKTAIHHASTRGHVWVVKYLLSYGIEAKDNDGWTPLHWAAYEGRLEVVRYLVGIGLSSKATDLKGKTPLDCAKSTNRFDVIQFLTEKPIGKKGSNYSLNNIVTLKNGKVINNVNAKVSLHTVEVRDANGKLTVYKKSEVKKIRLK